MQPIICKDGWARFKENAIVKHLIENSNIGLNDIASLEFSSEDREQLAMLIGYSVSGWSTLDYVNPESASTAELMLEKGIDEKDARIAVLEEKLKAVKDGFRNGISELFDIHPDDLE